MKEMRPELVVQFVRDRLAFLVVSVEHPFDQLPIGGAEARERFGEAIDPLANIDEFRRSRRLRARVEISCFETREGRAGDAERPQRSAHEHARGDDDGERQRAPAGDLIARLQPDFIDFVGRVGDDHDRVEAASIEHHRNRSHADRRADQSAKPLGRLDARIGRRGDCRGKRVFAETDAHMAQKLQAIDQRDEQPLRVLARPEGRRARFL